MKTWILVADSSRARILQLEDHRLQIVQEITYPLGRARAQDLVSDEPGRTVKGRGRQVMSAMDPRTSPHDVEQMHFARKLAQTLHEGRTARRYQSLALVAPPQFLGLLKSLLDPQVKAMVVATLDRDYTLVGEHQLRSLLSGMVDEIARVAHAE